MWMMMMMISEGLGKYKRNMKALATESLQYCELQQHKPWFDDECSELLYQRKQAKLQWMQNPCQINGDNLNNVRHKTSTTFRNRRGKCLKETMSLERQ
jgi:hypothetical protein